MTASPRPKRFDAELREAAGVAAGDRVSLAIAPSKRSETLEKAIEQSKRTTQPRNARADAIGRRAGTPPPASTEAGKARGRASVRVA